MISRADIVATARSLLGTPFRHNARIPGAAIDCLNVIGHVGLTLGVPGAQEWADDEDLRVYGRTPRGDVLLRKCDQYLDRVPRGEIGLGDILVMAFVFNPQHFAIVSRLDPMYVVHAYPTVGKVVENGVAIAGAKLLRAYRFRGVAA